MVMSRLSWRWLLAFSSLPSFVLLLFYSLAPESPRYLCVKGNTTDALRILEKMAQLNQQKLPSGLLVSTKTDRKDEEFAPTEEVLLLSSTRKNTEVVKNFLSTVCMIFSPNLTRTTLLLWMFYFGNVFSYYGIILLTSELSSGESKCGSTRFHPKNLQDASLYIDVFITSLAELPGLLLSAIIVDRVGRKLSFIIMLTLVCIFLLPLVFHQSAVLTTGLLFGARMCSMGSITVAYIYGPRYLP
ncbi:organic cation/carnitine transporter 7-like isoform X5 [Quercus robur]|uniref:organic cation/carnitine transporter 7-like isoform X5 n=1 Tax=Quercus robur TaxID=38942 RepID=UPI00216127D8|nr:organic cation/carnitine transporter 7-like isoform X5 [Quercus robur]